MSDIKKAIRVGLAQKNIQKQELAGRMGVTKGAVSGYMAGSGNLTIETVNKIAAALEMKTSEFVALGE